MRRQQPESTDFEAIHKDIDEVRQSLQEILNSLSDDIRDRRRENPR